MGWADESRTKAPRTRSRTLLDGVGQACARAQAELRKRLTLRPRPPRVLPPNPLSGKMPWSAEGVGVTPRGGSGAGPQGPKGFA
ncbi:unnamed protein product [Rangifer tarandus platyrhynchus]|uniref:Uncharacterized protein n=2 Tax=Rangifer tarandus platyrhynchus TaxID=3082113 RepID=A0ACB0EJU5_RANTA|nr:unnamed protein product [Rangifer tarandus platyrhynchus]CAI9700563.1 unnamed protein product [Rangifer tarandus platyrhynchus]